MNLTWEEGLAYIRLRFIGGYRGYGSCLHRIRGEEGECIRPFAHDGEHWYVVGWNEEDDVNAWSSLCKEGRMPPND
jgi:hypothetical protein